MACVNLSSHSLAIQRPTPFPRRAVLMIPPLTLRDPLSAAYMQEYMVDHSRNANVKPHLA
jgi:hypothetical protein